MIKQTKPKTWSDKKQNTKNTKTQSQSSSIKYTKTQSWASHIKPRWPSGFREREKIKSRSRWVSAMDLRPWGFGHGSSTMDLEKMNIKFKTQKTWIQSQIGRNTKLKTKFQTPHTTKASNTKIKPIFSVPKHKTQNLKFLIFKETK